MRPTDDSASRGGEHPAASPVSSTAILTALLWLGVLGAAGCATSTAQQPAPPHLVGTPGLSPPSRQAAPKTERREAPKRSGGLWYRIELARSAIQVHVRLLRPPKRTTFFAPGAWQGDSERQNQPAGGIEFGAARGPDGPVPTERIVSEHRIDVESAGLPWVELSYRVPLADATSAGRFAPRIAGSTVLAYAPALLVVPSKRLVHGLRDIPVEVHVPEDWTLQTTWQRVRTDRSTARPDHRVHGVLAGNLRELRDAFVAAGPKIVEKHRHSGRDRISVAFAPDFRNGREAVVDAVDRVVRFYRRHFGHVGPVSVFVQAHPNRSDRRLRGSGRRGGFILEMPDGPPDETSRLLIAHEAFHLWNGHRLVPAPKAEAVTRWFKEGATHYIALRAVHSLGYFESADVHREVARAAFNYRHNPAARGGRASALDHRRLPYDRGLLLALGLDAALYTSSGGELGLEQWFRRLLRESDGGPDRLFDLETLRTTFQRVAPSKCARCRSLWRRAIAGPGSLDVPRLLRRAGLHYLEQSSAAKSRVLPLEAAAPDFADIIRFDSP